MLMKFFHFSFIIFFERAFLIFHFILYLCGYFNHNAMKRLTAILFCFFSILAVTAQTDGDRLRQQAATALENKEYTTARFYYKRAYEVYSSAGKIEPAVECAVNVSSLYHRENFYKEAFEILRTADELVKAEELKSSKPAPALHYPISHERQRIYVKLKKSELANEQLAAMQQQVLDAGDRDLEIDLLSASAQQYYTFGQTEKGDKAINELIALYLSGGDYDKADECYKSLIDMALRTNNARLVGRSYEKYLAWNDSVSALRASERYDALDNKYKEACSTIEDRDSSITAKNAIIIGLIILAGVLAAALVFGALILLRYVALSRRQKKELTESLRREEIKNRFISNISAQMAPTISALDQNDPGVKALAQFTTHIQDLANLEAGRTEMFPTEDVNIATYLENIAEEVRPELAPDVTLTVNAPKMGAPVAPEELRLVLLHILRNAALHTPAGGRITVDFKKRGPHNIQFIVTDSGPGVDEELRADLFIPFACVNDLTQGDGLGLPICSLRISRMNGTIRLDDSFTSGARFVIELCP